MSDRIKVKWAKYYFAFFFFLYIYFARAAAGLRQRLRYFDTYGGPCCCYPVLSISRIAPAVTRTHTRTHAHARIHSFTNILTASVGSNCATKSKKKYTGRQQRETKIGFRIKLSGRKCVKNAFTTAAATTTITNNENNFSFFFCFG